MSEAILTQRPLEINGQHNAVTNQDQGIVLLAKLSALLELGLNCQLEEHTNANLHGYLWVLADLVEQLEEVLR